MKKHGFSVIETLIAVAIVGIIATAIMAFLPTISRTNQSTRTDQIFTIAAKGFMEIAAKGFMEEVRSSWTDTIEGREHFDSGTFTNGTEIINYIPANLPTGFSCQAAISDPDNGAFSPIQRKRVSLTCTAPGVSPVTFSIEFGRPE